MKPRCRDEGGFALQRTGNLGKICTLPSCSSFLRPNGEQTIHGEAATEADPEVSHRRLGERATHLLQIANQVPGMTLES